MNTLNVNINYNGIKIEAEFLNKINIFNGYSGTGKTLLMKATELYCMNNKISCRYCDYRCQDLEEDQIINYCKNAEVILLDNADLYLTNDLLEKLKDKFIVICMKDTSVIDMLDTTEYIVHYENQKLTIEEF